MPTSSRQKPRDRLLRAAQKAVVEHGADVRLKDIADMAGQTSGAVLYHFPDVQTLLVEANRAVMERFIDTRMQTLQSLSSPAERLVVTIESGLPTDADDDDVKLLCALGGAASRYPVYAAMLTSLYDRQVVMYQLVLETGAAAGDFRLTGSSETIGRNIVALEDAYGYRMAARHASIDHAVATELILDYARLATDHPLPRKGTP